MTKATKNFKKYSQVLQALERQSKRKSLDEFMFLILEAPHHD